MPEITAAAVKALRGRTGLPMMDCKRALEETQGDQDEAVKRLREQGKKVQETRTGRDISAGRLAVHSELSPGVGAMIELKCESAPVASSEEFKQFAHDLAKQLARGPGAKTADGLMAQRSLSKPGMTLAEQKDDMFNRIREVFQLGRILRIDAPCGGYAHHDGSSAVLLEVSGGTPEAAKDVAMHIAAMKPAVVCKEDLPSDAIDRERGILMEAARQEGKPENIIAKMVEGRLKNFFAEKVLLEQPFVKDEKMTVGRMAQEAGMKIVNFTRWEMGKPTDG